MNYISPNDVESRRILNVIDRTVIGSCRPLYSASTRVIGTSPVRVWNFDHISQHDQHSSDQARVSLAGSILPMRNKLFARAKREF
jgi:hypothetical protein